MPRLVEAWQRSPDGLSWTFRVRAGLRFHDGTPITPARIAELFLRVRAQRIGLADIAEFQTTERTLIIRLEQPSAFLLDELSEVPIVSDTKEMNGSGPFHIEVTTEDETILRSFESYFRGKPALDRVLVRTYPSVRSAWSAMMREEIDFLYEVGRESAEFVKNETTVKTFSFLRPYLKLIVFNVKNAAFRNPKVRQALNGAVNRPAIIDQVLNGHGEPAYSHIWPEHWAYAGILPPDSYDPIIVSQQLESLGYPLSDQLGGLSRLPSRIRFTCLVPSGYSHLERMALVVQRQLLEAGVDMQIELLPFSEFVQRVRTGSFEAFLAELVAGRTLVAQYRIWHSGAERPFASGYTSADRALEGLRRAATDEHLRTAVVELEETFREDPPALLLVWDRMTRAVSRRFQVEQQPNRDIISDIWQWRLAEPAVGARRR
jgi:peptide/nickel transport system substrate-binding protein